MVIRAVIFDIYGTFLEVLPPPADRETRWNQYWRKYHAQNPPLPLEAFATRCREEVSAAHARSRMQGVICPEVDWPSIAQEALPELKAWSESVLDDFLYQHAQLVKTVRLMTGAAMVLRQLVKGRVALGICSNCQAYSLRELTQALTQENLSLDLFDPSLCFYSFRAGFSKPNPEAFRILHQRLLQRGMAAAQVLMVGDREDNDIQPAKSLGWRTWQITSKNAVDNNGGDYNQLRQFLAGKPEPRRKP